MIILILKCLEFFLTCGRVFFIHSAGHGVDHVPAVAGSSWLLQSCALATATTWSFLTGPSVVTPPSYRSRVLLLAYKLSSTYPPTHS